MVPQAQSCSYSSSSVATHGHYFLSSHTRSLLCQCSLLGHRWNPRDARAFLATFLWVNNDHTTQAILFPLSALLGWWCYVWVVAETVSPSALLCHATRLALMPAASGKADAQFSHSHVLWVTAGFVCPSVPPFSCMLDQVSFGVGILGPEDKQTQRFMYRKVGII